MRRGRENKIEQENDYDEASGRDMTDVFLFFWGTPSKSAKKNKKNTIILFSFQQQYHYYEFCMKSGEVKKKKHLIVILYQTVSLTFP